MTLSLEKTAVPFDNRLPPVRMTQASMSADVNFTSLPPTIARTVGEPLALGFGSLKPMMPAYEAATLASVSPLRSLVGIQPATRPRDML